MGYCYRFVKGVPLKTDKPLNLTGSLSTYLEKAKSVCHFFEEDWDEIVPFVKKTSLLEEFSKAIQVSEQTYDEHRIAKISRTSKLKERRENLADLYSVYSEIREGLIFEADSEEDKRELRQKFPVKPGLDSIMIELLAFKLLLERKDSIPPYLPQDFSETYEQLHTSFFANGDLPLQIRLEQTSLRQKRDHAFREMLALQKLVKETGRFAFRNNPEMKKRYR